MDATKQMLDAVRKAKTKLTKEKNTFNNAMEIVGIKTEAEIDLFGGNAVSRVADIAAAVRKASDRLYTVCQTQIPLLDAECRPLLEHEPSTRAVKEVTALIQRLNSESEISTNFRGNLNGGTFYDLVGVRYIPSIDNKMIQTFWENKYSEMPDTAAEDKAFAARQNKERKEQISAKHQAMREILQEEREEEQRKKKAKEQEHQDRLARIAENAARTTERRDYLQRAREIVGSCGSKFAYIKADGTVVAKHNWAYSSPGDTSGFRGIRSVVCTEDGFVGLRYGGTCVSTVPVSDCQSRLMEVEKWNGIVALAAGEHHVVGLRKNGTCLATSFKHGAFQDCGQSNVGAWTEVQSIACGEDFTVGLRKDGTLLYAGPEIWNRDNAITKQTDIALIAAGGSSVIAVTKAGEIWQTGTQDRGSVKKAEHVVQVAVVDNRPYVLQADGTLLGGSEDPFDREKPMIVDQNVVALFGGNGLNSVLRYLREDGTLFEKKAYEKQGTPAVEERLFESYDAYWQIREDAEQARQVRIQQILNWREAGACQYCGGAFKKSLLGFKCSQCGMKKDY